VWLATATVALIALITAVTLFRRARRRTARPLRGISAALDMGAYVDPLAQADAYLFYGRRAAARQVLEEALRIAPERTDLRERLAQLM
jgi:Tfp pilus assembly protein FimV